MRCPEFREVMRSFLDGEVDGATRKEAGLHLAICEECAALVEDKKFWNDSIRSHLDHELPEGLRREILGDLDDLDDLGGRDQWRIAWWAVKRDLSRPRMLIQTAAMAAVLILAINYLPFFRSSGKSAAAFENAAPIVQVGEKASRQPGETVPTARLSLPGRLI